ncbi:hypothetical protein [Actinokineospora bangkokensis]|uniref:hypothetical protein n=1 Tax=Actinokineospora bangkokensis TaxID=1193682 RepID=UPI001178AFFC|nr:hypothetical protein [Actinokineospora bangkokensis]
MVLEPHERTALSDVVHATAVETLLWIRGFDRAARGQDGIDPLSGYVRPDWMRAATYVASKGVHRLVDLSMVEQIATPFAPLGVRPYAGVVMIAQYRWLDDPAQLPTPRPQDISEQTAFLTFWAGRFLSQTLAEVEQWIEQWIE